MNKSDNSDHDPVTDDPIVPDGLPDAAPNTPANPTDQPIEASPEAPGTPDAIDLQSADKPADPLSSDSHATDVPDTGTPEAPAPPTTNTPAAKQPRTKRPHSPNRANKLLKTDREGIGGPKTPEGKAITCLNSFKHGMYSRLPFYFMPGESQEEYDALLERLRTAYQPIDESSTQMLELHVQAFYRLGRCNHAEFLAESADQTNLEKFQRGISTVGMHRARCEKSYYLHLDKLKGVLADYKREQDEIQKKMEDDEYDKLEEEAKPKKRFNADGVEMHPDYPQRVIRKISCLPESHCNEVLEYDRPLIGRVTVKRTPLRDWQGGWMLHPSWKPPQVKHDWPDYAMGRYKEYYMSRKAEDIKDINADLKKLFPDY